jgi:hypothetical protein
VGETYGPSVFPRWLVPSFTRGLILFSALPPVAMTDTDAETFRKEAEEWRKQADWRPHFSLRTPLNFLAALVFLAGFFTAMNSPLFLFRFVQAVAPPSFVSTCERFFTAPFRALSPTGLFTAMAFVLPLPS